MWIVLNPSSLSVSPHRFSQEGSYNRGERLLHSIHLSLLPSSCPSLFLSLFVCCLVQFLKPPRDDIQKSSSYMKYICISLFSPLVIDAVSVRGGPCPREKDRPQEGRCLWRDNIQESKLLFSLSASLFVLDLCI